MFRYYVATEKGCPVYPDKAKLDLSRGFGEPPWQEASVYDPLEWTECLKNLPTIMIRNIQMRDGSVWKANWGEMLQCETYIDVGSGKIAEISTRTGEQ